MQIRSVIKRENTSGPKQLFRDEENAVLRGYLLWATIILINMFAVEWPCFLHIYYYCMVIIVKNLIKGEDLQTINTSACSIRKERVLLSFRLFFMSARVQTQFAGGWRIFCFFIWIEFVYLVFTYLDAEYVGPTIVNRTKYCYLKKVNI